MAEDLEQYTAEEVHELNQAWEWELYNDQMCEFDGE